MIVSNDNTYFRRENKMKKAIKLLSLILCLVMAFSLVACGGNDTASSKDDDDKKDASSTASTTSSTESTTASTGSETTSTNTNSTASQPAGEEQPSVVSYSTPAEDGSLYIVAIYYFSDNKVATIAEGNKISAGEGMMFDEATQTSFKNQIQSLELDEKFAKAVCETAASEMTFLIAYNVQVEGGLEYYKANSDLLTEMVTKDMLVSELQAKLVAAGYTPYTEE
jgi:hypothetical protein